MTVMSTVWIKGAQKMLSSSCGRSPREPPGDVDWRTPISSCGELAPRSQWRCLDVPRVWSWHACPELRMRRTQWPPLGRLRTSTWADLSHRKPLAHECAPFASAFVCRGLLSAPLPTGVAQLQSSWRLGCRACLRCLQHVAPAAWLAFSAPGDSAPLGAPWRQRWCH